jgi:hypothetical protein
VAAIDAMARHPVPGASDMRDVPATPFPFPPVDGAEVRFPDQPPLDVEIFRMSNWWLQITCDCGIRHTPLRLLAAERGWRVTLRQLVPKLRCKTCGQRPTSVMLEDTADGDAGRFGATKKLLPLK